MSQQGTHLSQRHAGRRLAILASLLVLAIVTGVSGMFGGSAEVARQGPFPVHPRTPATVPDDEDTRRRQQTRPSLVPSLTDPLPQA